MTKLIKMIRQDDGKTAEVHPDEVSNFARGGFVKADDQPSAPSAPAANAVPGTISATAQKLIDDNGLKIEEIKATGQDGSITVKDVKEAIKAKKDDKTPPPPAPVAVKTDPVFADEETATFAADAGIDLSKLVGTGEKGVVTMEDIEKAIDAEGDE